MNAITTTQPQQPSQGSHAAAAAAELRQAITAAHTSLRSAVTAYRAACAARAPEADLLEVLRAAGNVVLAAEAITAAGKHLEATARAALAQALMDTGACSIRTSSHTFSASAGRQSVTVISAADVPEHLLHRPPPSPDRAKILRLLKAGQSVPGCELSNGNQPFLTVKAI